MNMGSIKAVGRGSARKFFIWILVEVDCRVSTKNSLLEILVERFLAGFHQKSASLFFSGFARFQGSTEKSLLEILVEQPAIGATL